MKRLTSARVVDLSARLAIINYHVLEASKRDESLKQFRFIQMLDEVEPESFQDYQSITQTSYLVYGMAILDSFITETTSFLFLKNPAALGKKEGVAWDVFLNRDKRTNTIVDAANRKARDIAFWPLNRRLELLQKNFHIKINIAEDVLADVTRYVEIRNAAVHDHTIVGLSLDENDRVISHSRTEPPKRLKSGDLRLALHAFSSVIAGIFMGVCESFSEQSSELKPVIEKLYTVLNATDRFRENWDDEPPLNQSDRQQIGVTTDNKSL